MRHRVASVDASVTANSHNSSSTACRRLSGDWDSNSGRRDSILAAACTGKFRHDPALWMSLRRGDSSAQVSAARSAHSLVNQTTSAVCGRASSMADVDAQVWGMSAGTRVRSRES